MWASRPYDATQAYAVSKLANVLHTRELAARLQVCPSVRPSVPLGSRFRHGHACALNDSDWVMGDVMFLMAGVGRVSFHQEMGANVTVNCVHPGIVRTRLNRDRDGVLTGE